LLVSISGFDKSHLKQTLTDDRSEAFNKPRPQRPVDGLGGALFDAIHTRRHKLKEEIKEEEVELP